MHAKGAHVVTFSGLVHRAKGNRFQNPLTGKWEVSPGGEYHNGIDGAWYDHGVLTKRRVTGMRLRWLMVRMRIELQEFLKFLNTLIRRR